MEPKVWHVFDAARYVNGVMVEGYEHGTKSSMAPAMVELAEYERLAKERDEARVARDLITDQARTEIKSLRSALEEIAARRYSEGWEEPIPYPKSADQIAQAAIESAPPFSAPGKQP